CSALERGIAAIADRPEAPGNDRRDQAAAKSPRGAFWRCARTSEIGVGNTARHNDRRGARAGAIRGDVVEDAVITEVELVHHVGREDVRPAQGEIASV